MEKLDWFSRNYLSLDVNLFMVLYWLIAFSVSSGTRGACARNLQRSECTKMIHYINSVLSLLCLEPDRPPVNVKVTSKTPDVSTKHKCTSNQHVK